MNDNRNDPMITSASTGTAKRPSRSSFLLSSVKEIPSCPDSSGSHTTKDLAIPEKMSVVMPSDDFSPVKKINPPVDPNLPVLPAPENRKRRGAKSPTVEAKRSRGSMDGKGIGRNTTSDINSSEPNLVNNSETPCSDDDFSGFNGINLIPIHCPTINRLCHAFACLKISEFSSPSSTSTVPLSRNDIFNYESRPENENQILTASSPISVSSLTFTSSSISSIPSSVALHSMTPSNSKISNSSPTSVSVSLLQSSEAPPKSSETSHSLHQNTSKKDSDPMSAFSSRSASSSSSAIPSSADLPASHPNEKIPKSTTISALSESPSSSETSPSDISRILDQQKTELYPSPVAPVVTRSFKNNISATSISTVLPATHPNQTIPKSSSTILSTPSEAVSFSSTSSAPSTVDLLSSFSFQSSSISMNTSTPMANTSQLCSPSECSSSIHSSDFGSMILPSPDQTPEDVTSGPKKSRPTKSAYSIRNHRTKSLRYRPYIIPSDISSLRQCSPTLVPSPTRSDALEQSSSNDFALEINHDISISISYHTDIDTIAEISESESVIRGWHMTPLRFSSNSPEDIRSPLNLDSQTRVRHSSLRYNHQSNTILVGAPSSSSQNADVKEIDSSSASTLGSLQMTTSHGVSSSIHSSDFESMILVTSTTSSKSESLPHTTPPSSSTTRKLLSNSVRYRPYEIPSGTRASRLRSASMSKNMSRSFDSERKSASTPRFVHMPSNDALNSSNGEQHSGSHQRPEQADAPRLTDDFQIVDGVHSSSDRRHSDFDSNTENSTSIHSSSFGSLILAPSIDDVNTTSAPRPCPVLAPAALPDQAAFLDYPCPLPIDDLQTFDGSSPFSSPLSSQGGFVSHYSGAPSSISSSIHSSSFGSLILAPSPTTPAPSTPPRARSPAPFQYTSSSFEESSFSEENSTRSSSELSLVSTDGLNTARSLTPPPPPIPVILPAAPIVRAPRVQAPVQAPRFPGPLRPQQAAILVRVREALRMIDASFKLILHDDFEREKTVLDITSQLTRSRSTLRRHEKEILARSRTDNYLEASTTRLERSLRNVANTLLQMAQD